VHQRRVFLLAFAAFFLVSAAWALALPTDGTYDEKHHIIRAYAVAEGRLFPAGPASDGTGFGSEGFDVPASLVPRDVNCLRPRGVASCQHPTADRELVRVPSAAARYSPVYYLPVGLPLLISPDHAGVVWARGVSALLSALLLAAAVVTAVRLGSRLLVAGVVLVATPMVMNLSGAVNPNGLEIAAGVLLFTTLTAILRGVVTRRLLVLTGVAAALLLTVRQLGPLLLAVDVAACAVVAGRERVGALWRHRDARRVLGAWVLAGALVDGVWAAVSGGPDTGGVPGRAEHTDLVGRVISERLPFYAHQLVGQFGYGEATISTVAVAFWYLLWAVVIVPALIWGGGRLRLVIAGLAGFSLALLVALDLHFAPLSGWFAHSRYIWPSAAGTVLLAALAEGGPARWLAARRVRWLTVAVVAATAPVQLYALARVMTRYQSGLDAALDPFAGRWLPPGGPALPLVAMAAGLAGLIAVTDSAFRARGVVVAGAPDDGSVTPDNRSVTADGQNADSTAKASTTDAANH
jgi:hypothetical protein